MEGYKGLERGGSTRMPSVPQAPVASSLVPIAVPLGHDSDDFFVVGGPGEIIREHLRSVEKALFAYDKHPSDRNHQRLVFELNNLEAAGRIFLGDGAQDAWWSMATKAAAVAVTAYAARNITPKTAAIAAIGYGVPWVSQVATATTCIAWAGSAASWLVKKCQHTRAPAARPPSTTL